MPQVVDDLAATVPDRVYAAIPKTSDVKDGYRDITIADLARCVNFMARWLEGRFGKSKTFETITYVGLSDLKGIATLLAAIKVGYKVGCITVVGWEFFVLTSVDSSLSLHRAIRQPSISI